ncbi:MAG: hypothetical protein M3Q44_00260 [bacterium]|nr:hypothetical protein [bacterium]
MKLLKTLPYKNNKKQNKLLLLIKSNKNLVVLSSLLFVIIASTLIADVSGVLPVNLSMLRRLDESAAAYPQYGPVTSCDNTKAYDQTGCKYMEKCTAKKICEYNPNWINDSTSTQKLALMKQIEQDYGVKIQSLESRDAADMLTDLIFNIDGPIFGNSARDRQRDFLHTLYPNFAQQELDALLDGIYAAQNNTPEVKVLILGSLMADFASLFPLGGGGAISKIDAAGPHLPKLFKIGKLGRNIKISKTSISFLKTLIGPADGVLSTTQLTARIEKAGNAAFRIVDPGGSGLVFPIEKVLSATERQVVEITLDTFKKKVPRPTEGLRTVFSQTPEAFTTYKNYAGIQILGVTLEDGTMVLHANLLTKGITSLRYVATHEAVEVAYMKGGLGTQLRALLPARIDKLYKLDEDDVLSKINAFKEGVAEHLAFDIVKERPGNAYTLARNRVAEIFPSASDKDLLYQALNTGDISKLLQGKGWSLDDFAEIIYNFPDLLVQNNVQDFNFAYNKYAHQRNQFTLFHNFQNILSLLAPKTASAATTIKLAGTPPQSNLNKDIGFLIKALNGLNQDIETDEDGISSMIGLAGVGRSIIDTKRISLNNITVPKTEVGEFGWGYTLSNGGTGGNPPPADGGGSGSCPRKTYGANDSLQGYLDKLEINGSLQGWGIDKDKKTHSIDIHFYLDKPAGEGTFIGSTTTDVDRTDINTRFNTSGRHGFNYMIPDEYKDGKVHCIYTHGIDLNGGYNIELEGSPIRLSIPKPGESPKPSSTPRMWEIVGHVTDENGKGIPGVKMQIDGMGAAGYQKSYFPVTNAQGVFKQGGFIVFRGLYNVKVFGNEQNPPTAPSGFTAPARTNNRKGFANDQCSKNDTLVGATAYMCQKAGSNDCTSETGGGPRCVFVYGNISPYGFLDKTNGDQISGWAVDGNEQNKSVDVHLYMDGPAGTGKFLGIVNANLKSPDLGYPGNHRFSWTIPQQYRDGKTHNVYAHAIDTKDGKKNVILSGSPQYFKLSPDFGDKIPVGWLDGFSNDIVSGWSRDDDTPNTPTRVDIYFDGPAGGSKPGTGFSTFANLNRSDVGKHGYNFNIPAKYKDGRTHIVYVYGINTNDKGANAQLSGTPKTYKSQAPVTTAPAPADRAPVGYFDGFYGDLASGWTRDDDTPAYGLQVHLYVGGPAGSGAGHITIASLNRSDVGPHGFNFNMPAQYKDGKSYLVYAYGINSKSGGTNTLLTGSPKTYKYSLPATPAPILDRAPRGWLDGFYNDVVSGWSIDDDTPNTATRVDLYFDGQAGSGAKGFNTWANLYRSDIGSHGYNFNIPANYKDGQNHTVYAYGINTKADGANVLLSGAPKTYRYTSTAPACGDLVGPTSIKLGQSATYSGNFASAQGSLGVVIGYGANGQYLGPWPPRYPGGTSYSGSWTFTPASAGTYNVACRVWNDSIQECAGLNGWGIPACAGPNSRIVLTVNP